MYQNHPSQALNQLFSQRPYQGVAPESAEFVFVGLDANYAPDIEQTAVFPALLEYHADGASFWRKHGVHHPFLLPSYRGDGRRYHLNFSRIGFTAKDAHRISFVELLHVPTVGRNQLEVSDLNPEHLDRIGRLMTSGAPRHVFVSPGVLRCLLSSKRFGWLRSPARTAQLLPLLYSSGQTQVHQHLHFSNYGKFQAQMDMEAAAIRQLAG